MNKTQVVFNPFEGKNPNEVWEEIRKKSKPTTREQAMKELATIRKCGGDK